MTTKSRAELALFGITFIWGGTFPIVKIAMVDVSPILMIAIRFAVASSVLLLFFRRRIFPIPRASVYKGAVLGLFLFLGFVAQNIGLTITTASKSAFITGMMVLFVPVLQYFVERRPPLFGNLAGVAVVTAGLWFLTSPEGSSLNTGDALTVVCALFFAGYIIYLDIISKEMTTLQLLFVQMTATAVYAVAATALFETPHFAWTGNVVAMLLYLTILATLFTTAVQTRFQKDTTPTRTVVIFSIEPVVASILAYFILGEQIGSMGAVGGALIIGGVLLSQLSDGIPGLNRPVIFQL